MHQFGQLEGEYRIRKVYTNFSDDDVTLIFLQVSIKEDDQVPK